MRIMGRFTIRVDDEEHRFALRGDPVRVESPTPDTLEFWAEVDHTDPGPVRTFRVFGTGHALPPNVKHVGTAGRSGSLVWHLYEVTGA